MDKISSHSSQDLEESSDIFKKSDQQREGKSWCMQKKGNSAASDRNESRAYNKQKRLAVC